MVKFAEMMGTGGEFRAVLENKLKNFVESSDYYTYQEASGRVRKKYYVICSERPVRTLQEVDWKSLEGFKRVRVGEEVGSGISGEPMKFVVETLTNEWVSYQTDKPNFQNSMLSSSVIPQRQKEMLERQTEMNKRKLEMEKRKSEFYGNHVYSQKFEDGSWKTEETFQPPSGHSVKKHCSNCRTDKETPADTNFCQNCGQRLSVEPQIQEISDQSASTSNYHKSEKGLKFDNKENEFSKKNNSEFGIIVAISVLVSLVIAGVILVKKNFRKKLKSK